MNEDKKTKLNYLVYPFFLITFILAALELVLRIYNPLSPRLKGDEIVLPINQTLHITNLHVAGLDSNIVHTKNSIGFRGQNPPKDLGNSLSILTVGGSTTECRFISDGKTWEDLLNEKIKHRFNHVWLNNAGLDGHSTFGHLILTKKSLLQLKPKVIIYLVGCNDVEVDKIKESDLNNVGTNAQNVKQFLNKHSELYSTFQSLKKAYQAKKTGLTYNTEFDLPNRDTVTISSDSLRQVLSYQQKFIPNYQKRVDSLIVLCKKSEILPVFITQPNLSGNIKDEITGVDLSKIMLDNGMNGDTYWQVLKLYNQATQESCKKHKVLCIDLANRLPKSSAIFYDNIHYTNKGCESIAEIVSADLLPWLQTQFHSFLKPSN